MAEKKGLYYYVNKRKKAGTSRSKNNPKAPSDADWKNAAKTAKVSEAIVDHAGTADSDHEVQMARADLYNIADKALKLHKILKNISEQEGLQGWQQAKITKAADYLDAVFSSLNYETMSTMTSVQTRPASNGSVGVASTAMSESEVADYKSLLEKAKSKAQQRLMGAVHAAQQGEQPASPKVAKMAKTMPKKAAKDFAATKHKGLPAHVSENELDATEAKWYSNPSKPRYKPKTKPAAGAAPQKKNRLRNIAGAAALAGAGLGAGAVGNDYVQNFGNNNTVQATQSQQAADVGGAGLSGAKATAKNTTGSLAAQYGAFPSDADLDAQAAQIEKDFAAKNAKNDANAKAQSSAERDAAQGKVGGVRPSGPAAGMPGMSNAQIAAMIHQQQADREAAIDTDIDKLGGQVQQAGGMVNKFAKGVNSISNTTAADTPPGPAPTVDPTFMPKNTPKFVDAKENWLATNPTSTQVDRYNEMISFFNKAVANGDGNIRIKAIQGTSKWLRDPNNAGRGSVNSNESRKYRNA